MRLLYISPAEYRQGSGSELQLATTTNFADNNQVNVLDLREATAANHARAEGALPLLHPGLTRAEYTRTLERLYVFVAKWEQELLANATAAIRPVVEVRLRASLLAADLEALGGVKGRWETEERILSQSELLGEMYVMEGSRLGGQLIAKHVEQTIGSRPGEVTSYLRGFGSATKSMWLSFVDVLDREIPAGQAQQAVDAAKALFGALATWMLNDVHASTAVDPSDNVHSGK